MLVELGLGIEQVHLAGTAIHEQLNDRLRFRLEVRAFGREVKRGRAPRVLERPVELSR